MARVKTDDGLTRFSVRCNKDEPMPSDLRELFQAQAGLRITNFFGKERYMSAAAPDEALGEIQKLAHEHDCAFQITLKAETFADTINSLEDLTPSKP